MTGKIIVIEKYRDGQGTERSHYGCDTCHERVHWYNHELGEDHACQPGHECTDLCRELGLTVPPQRNTMWDTPVSLIDETEYCVDCERRLPHHYDGCPVTAPGPAVRAILARREADEGGYGQGFTTALILANAPRKD